MTDLLPVEYDEFLSSLENEDYQIAVHSDTTNLIDEIESSGAEIFGVTYDGSFDDAESVDPLEIVLKSKSATIHIICPEKTDCLVHFKNSAFYSASGKWVESICSSRS